MRTNGFIQIQTLHSEAGSFDDDGNPIGAAEANKWGKLIPCNIKTNTHNNKGKYEDGKFTISSYDILIEYQEEHFNPSRIKLLNEYEELGDFEIQNIIYLRSMGRIKIIV